MDKLLSWCFFFLLSHYRDRDREKKLREVRHDIKTHALQVQPRVTFSLLLVSLLITVVRKCPEAPTVREKQKTER